MYKLLLLPLLLMLISTNGHADGMAEGYKFGVFPYLPTNRIKKVYTPVAQDFENTVGQSVTLRTKKSYKEFKKALFKGEYDIAFIQPYDYIEAYDRYDYLPLVRRGVPLRTVIIVKKDSAINNLTELKGKIIATPGALSAVAKIMDQSLSENGFDMNTDVARKYKKTTSPVCKV